MAAQRRIRFNGRKIATIADGWICLLSPRVGPRRRQIDRGETEKGRQGFSTVAIA